MPLGDRTGPLGQGPRTGRGLGFCSGYDSPGYTKGFGGGMGRGFGFGRGMGRGIGRGRGFGRGRYYGLPYVESFYGYPWMQPLSKDDEIKMLKSQAESLKITQKDIERRLSELEKGND
jgi:hypothetical protein